MATSSQNMTGAALMSASMAAFVLNDACVKALAADVPLFQILFLRGIGSTLAMAVLARAIGQWHPRLPRRDWGKIGLRTGAEITAAYFFLTALIHMPLANATAILQTLPLTVTFAGAVIFGEAVGWRRWTAIAVGFLGVLLIVQPGTDGFSVFSLYVLAAVGAVTTRDLVTRALSPGVPSLMVALVGSIGVTLVAGLASTLQPWAPLSGQGWWLLVGSVLWISAAYVFSVATMRVGDLGAVTPFRYTALLWSLLVGYLAFGDWPNAVALAGAALITGAGLYTLVRTRALRGHQNTGT